MTTNGNHTYGDTQSAAPPSPVSFFNPNVDPAVFNDEQAVASADYILRCGDTCDNETFVMNYIAGREAVVRKLISKKRAKRVSRILAWRREEMMAQFTARAKALREIKDDEERLNLGAQLEQEYLRVLGRDNVTIRSVDIAQESEEIRDRVIEEAAKLFTQVTHSSTLNEALAKIGSLNEKQKALFNRGCVEIIGYQLDDVVTFLKQSFATYLDRNVPIRCISFPEALNHLAASAS